jgi:predicted nucleotidyltransferase
VERLHRVLLELAVFVPFWWLAFATGSSTGGAAGIAFLAAHTLNAVLNGQPWALLIHDNPRFNRYRRPDKYLAWIEALKNRLDHARPSYLREAVVFGSVVRGVFRETSDLDVRFIANDGFWNAFRTAHLVFLERARSVFSGFPLDLYMFRTREETERKMRVRDEPAIRLYGTPVTGTPVVDNAGTFHDLEARLSGYKAARKPPRVILLGAGGGHLLEVQIATEGVPMRRVFATFRLPHTAANLAGERCYYLVDPHGNMLKYIWNFLQSLWLVLRERPHAIINTGGGMTIATSLLGKLFGARLIYIESAARVQSPSRTGRLLYPYTDLFLVQWERLLKEFPKAKYGGPLL